MIILFPCQQVLVPKDDSLLGKMFEVVITTTGKHYLKGDVLAESLVRAPSRPTPLPQGTVSGATEWRKRSTEATIASHRTDKGSMNPGATEKSELCETLSSKSRTRGWLRLGDVLLLLMATLLLCVALVLSHNTQLLTVKFWSR